MCLSVMQLAMSLGAGQPTVSQLGTNWIAAWRHWSPISQLHPKPGLLSCQ